MIELLKLLKKLNSTTYRLPEPKLKGFREIVQGFIHRVKTKKRRMRVLQIKYGFKNY